MRIQYGSRSWNTAYRYYSFTTNNNLSRLFDLSSGQHLLDLGGELRNGAGQLDLAWLDQATFLACGYDTCTRLWDTRCSTYVRTWEDPFDESGELTSGSRQSQF